MKAAGLTWNKKRYVWLMIKEYVVSALGKKKPAYLLRYERDSMIPRSTPEFLLDYLDHRLTTQTKILDIACGDGDLLDRLKERSVQAFGMDLSAARTLRASLNGREIVQGDMHCIPFRPHSFDVVIASGILQQTTDPYGALQEWADMVRDDGVLVVLLGNIPAFKRRWLRSAGQRWKVIGYRSQYRIIYNTQSRFVECLEGAGLVIEELIDHPSSENPEQWIAICRKG